MGNTTTIETFLAFASYYHQQLEHELAALLLGYAQIQPGLPAVLVQSYLKPLHTSLAESLDEDRLSVLLDEGAALDQQELIDRLLADCG